MEESGSLDGQMHEEAGITNLRSGLSMNEEAPLRAGSAEGWLCGDHDHSEATHSSSVAGSMTVSRIMVTRIHSLPSRSIHSSRKWKRRK